MGLALVDRSLTNLKLRTPVGEVVSYTVLQIFPFTSETKRMGIILKEEATGDITFYMKVCFDPFLVSFHFITKYLMEFFIFIIGC